MKNLHSIRIPATPIRAVLAFVALLLAAGSIPGTAQTVQHKPGEFTRNDFKALKWLEGSWKGKGEQGNPFYERYKMTSDSTMEISFFTDESFTKTSDIPVMVHLSSGHIYYRSGNTLWAASEFSGRRIQFAPRQGARNHFTFSLVSPKEWTAVLQWPGSQPGRPDVTYRLERLEV